MYIAILNYLKPVDEITSVLEEQRAYLQVHCDNGNLVVCGPTILPGAEVIFSTLEVRGDFEQILNHSPLIINKAAEFTTTAFRPHAMDPEFEPFVKPIPKRTIILKEYDPNWAVLFKGEAQKIKQALGDNLMTVHHIGSTAIPGIYAKPVIDMIPVVRDIEKVDNYNQSMESLGYEVRGEFGMSGRRFFVKALDEPTFNAHVWQQGSPQIERHVQFRDYMIAHPQDAQAYSDLKRDLAEKYPHDIEGYCSGKDDFVQEIDRQAKEENAIIP